MLILAKDTLNAMSACCDSLASMSTVKDTGKQ